MIIINLKTKELIKCKFWSNNSLTCSSVKTNSLKDKFKSLDFNKICKIWSKLAFTEATGCIANWLNSLFEVIFLFNISKLINRLLYLFWTEGLSNKETEQTQQIKNKIRTNQANWIYSTNRNSTNLSFRLSVLTLTSTYSNRP